MFPAHVRGLDDALFWTRAWVSNLAAVDRDVDDPVVGVLQAGRLVGLSVGPVVFAFADGRRLGATVHVDEDLRPRYYRFNLVAADDSHLWAYHWHPGHEDLGGPHHAHLTSGDATAVHAHPAIDFEFIAARTTSDRRAGAGVMLGRSRQPQADAGVTRVLTKHPRPGHPLPRGEDPLCGAPDNTGRSTIVRAGVRLV